VDYIIAYVCTHAISMDYLFNQINYYIILLITRYII